MRIEQVTLTPEDAAHLRANNPVNRLLNPRRVNLLAESIERGEWVFDGNPIRLTSDGRLLDGQHRLAAIEQAGIPVSVVIIRGLEAESQLVIDSGRARTFSDYLRMRGVAQVHRLASMVRLLANVDSGNFYTSAWRDFYPSSSYLWAYYGEHREELEDGLSMINEARHHIRMLPSVLGVLGVLVYRADPGDAVSFFAEISKKSKPSNSVMILTRTLDNRDQKADTGSREQRIELALGLKAWLRYRAQDDSSQLLAWRRTERFPKAA